MSNSNRGVFNLLEWCNYVYDTCYYLQENNLAGKIKINKPLLIAECDLPVSFMGYELIWV